MPKEMIMRRSITNCLFLAAANLLLASGLAASPPYPTHPVRLLVGGAAGSVPDILVRPVAERLSTILGQPVVVDNRPGAAGSIAMDVLVHSAPDGYTLALATMSQAVFNTYLFSKLPYDPLHDLEPVSPLATGAMAIAAHPSFPASTLQELIPLARSQPGKLFMAMPQTGSPPHVIALLLSRAAGIELTMVPHKAGSEALNSVLSNQIPLLIDAPTILSPYVADGRLKALVVTGSERELALPGVATASESGLQNLQGEAWIGLVGPAGMPKEIVQQINRELALILAAPDMQAQLARQSFRPLTATPEEFRTLIKAEHAKWGSVIRDAGLNLD
jgi:tripartite-type tricarboxylate transporter receptor subunit TctC